MRLRKWLEKWEMTSLKINIRFLEMDWEPNSYDEDAAWELYIELLTRIATQHHSPEHGDEKSALDSIHALFGLTRGILKAHTRNCQQFSRIAIPVLNQIVRPFTAKWHRLSMAGAFSDESQCSRFRDELFALQEELRKYTRMLGAMAGVEDMTGLEV
ncbi:MAG: hypothetical protein HGA70_10580 [Chlorobiaceae bacterium]|nr:hypothetical protein [Chlorobiaceae bacterium]